MLIGCDLASRTGRVPDPPLRSNRQLGDSMGERSARSYLSVVVPCYNEDSVLPLLRQRLVAVLESLDATWDVLLVDDGSTDRTLEVANKIHDEDSRFKIIALTRNFGHQAAISAGLHYAAGDVVAVLDADLQDPPEVLVECFNRWREGWDVVYAVRHKRQESILLRVSYAVFYRLLKAVADISIPLDSGDFCVMDRQVVNALRSMPERNMFVRGMRAWSGFRQTGVVYERALRAAGLTKYSFPKLVRLAVDGILSFSALPLRAASFVGGVTMFLDVIAITFIVVWRVFGFEFMGHTARELPGWTGALSVALFLGGVQLFILGIVGEYIARIYDEVKRRPRWIVRTVRGVSRPPVGVE